ncbi:hypothetical protein [Candidatus Magnetaquiglobus chichijimensis]|uniref:hypothetical protein n=1 Tax=Candidatus Magnetaquiglobus chichijimensis TaxID=3141448 RepID=UPI003B979069
MGGDARLHFRHAIVGKLKTMKEISVLHQKAYRLKGIREDRHHAISPGVEDIQRIWTFPEFLNHFLIETGQKLVRESPVDFIPS